MHRGFTPSCRIPRDIYPFSETLATMLVYLTPWTMRLLPYLPRFPIWEPRKELVRQDSDLTQSRHSLGHNILCYGLPITERIRREIDREGTKQCYASKSTQKPY